MEKVKTYKLVNNSRVETSKIYERDTEWTKEECGYYIVGINNWIMNTKGEFLVQRRSLTKKNNPGKWSSTNGLIQFEEKNIDTVLRETKEELNIDIAPYNVHLIKENHVVSEHLLVDIFITITDIELSQIKIQKSEVDKVRFVSLKELTELDVSSTCSYIKELAPIMYDKYKFILEPLKRHK